MKYIKYILIILSIATLNITQEISAQNITAEDIREQGKFDNWIVREIEESGVIGGETRYIYNFNTGDTLKGNEPYIAPPGNVFITSNVMANVVGIYKASNQVFPEKRGDGYCARMEVIEEAVKVVGLINVRVIAQGSVITGKLQEPIRDTKSPYSKLDCGIPFTERPLGIKYDYKADVGHEKIKATTQSAKKDGGDPDYANIILLLQKRWEDEDGKIYAKRVGTAHKRIKEDVDEWVNGEILEVKYGDITQTEGYEEYMGLRSKGTEIENFAQNSKGKTVAINEIGWAEPNETPTHLILWFSASDGNAFYGGVGNKLWLDNVELVY